MNQLYKSKNAQSPSEAGGMLKRIQSLSPPTHLQHCKWMLQMSQHAVEIWKKDFLSELDPKAKLSHCGRDFFELMSDLPLNHKQLLDTGLPRWICPIEHRWPAQPNAIDFVERAAQGLIKKFGTTAESIVVVSPTPELRKVAAHVRARLRQIFTDQVGTPPLHLLKGTTLNVLIYKKGVIAGVSVNKASTGSVFDAGLGFLRSKAESTQISRAAGKITEVLDFLSCANIDCKSLDNWLELGAAPGGMTHALVQAGAKVTAVDLADMEPALLEHPNVTHLRIHADAISSASSYSALLSDMNGPYESAISIVSRLIRTLSTGSLIVHTLKVQDFKTIKIALDTAKSAFLQSGAQVVFIRHLFHNRKELTLIAVRS